jgi:RNA polymerase sigma-70 factor, ECF subfamily
MHSLSSAAELSVGPSGLPKLVAYRNPETAYDADLVRKFKNGDDAAFIEIMARHWAKMIAIGMRFLRNHADAEEIAQDTFIRAHRALPFFRGDSSLSTWLHRIALNLSRNRYWYFQRRHRQDSQSFDSTLSDGNTATLADLVASSAPDPAREASTQDFVQQLAAGMEKLSAKHREILTLRNSLDRSYAEIARALHLDLGTVKSRIGRARHQLRRHLDEAYAESQPGELASPWFESSRLSGRVSAASH